jgi:hypothetical protein
MRKAGVGILVLFASSSLLAQHVEIPVTNWTVPPYRTPFGGLSPMVDVNGPRAFIPVQPCRIVDTRLAVGPYGGPALAANVTRTFDIPAGPCLGIPIIGITAYSLSIGAILPPADGFLTAWPFASSQPVVSQLNFLTNEVVANAAIVPNGDNNSINVRVNVGPTNIYIDINGYFSSNWTGFSGNFYLNANTTNPLANFVNDSTGCSQGCALWAVSHSTSTGQAIYADLPSGGNNAAAVEGHHGPFFAIPGYTAAGIRGESPLVGVLGISGGTSSIASQGVAGSLLNVAGAEITWGALGSLPGVDSPGVPPWGVFSGGSIGAVGTKHFLDPHPTDPSRAIGYVSLEGPEAGTYFRGRARFQNGMARIPVPEHFRLVTDSEGLTVQITPIGAMASFAVLKMDLDEIVVQASRNVEFSYLVQGVRSTYKDVAPFRGAAEFMPRSADAKLPLWLSPAQRQLLIQNGTYREDGTVNMETARRLGWDRLWAEGAGRPVPAPTP